MGARSVRVQVLGSLRAWNSTGELDLGPPGRRAVLGLLVLAGGEALTSRELVDVLWDDPPRSALNVLQTHVKHLRRLLEPDRPARTGSEVLPHVRGGYAVNRDVVDVDLLRVRQLVAEANIARRDGDTARAAELFGRALRLWPGSPLADIPVLATHPKVVALVAERREILGRYGDAMIATGAAAEALPAIAEAAAGQPLDEPAQARLIRAYHAVGQRAQAFQVYHAVRHRLVEELGVDPGPALRAAHAELLAEPDFAPLVGTVVPRQLPAEPGGFTGRAAELSSLDNLLPVVPIAAISGAAGVGKSALAVRWAHRVRDRFPDGQLYADLRGHARPTETLARFLSALGIPAERLPTDPDTAAALYRTLTADRKMLVLLDNVASSDQVRQLLPSGQGSFVLVTGRDRMVGLVATHGARELTLDVLNPDDALELLARALGPERVRAEQDAAADLAELCVHLPLALRIAAADLAGQPRRGIADHVAELREGNLLTVSRDERTATRAPRCSPRRLRTVGNEARRRKDAGPRPAKRFHLAGQANWPASQAEALVHWEMGRLWQAAEHYTQALRRAGSRHGEAINLSRLGQVRHALGSLIEAARLLTRALVLCRETGHRRHEAETHSRLALVHADLGRHGEALNHARTGLVAAEQAGSPRTRAEALTALAGVYHRIGRQQEAISRYHQALELTAGDPYAEIDALTGLAVATGEPGHARHALALAERVGYRALQGLALTALAEILLSQGSPADAAEHARRALAVHRETGHRMGESRGQVVLAQVQSPSNGCPVPLHSVPSAGGRTAGRRRGDV